MATHRIPILGWATMPDNSGSVYPELMGTNFAVNNLSKHQLWVFANTAAAMELYGLFQVPQNYVGTAKVVLVWGTTATTGACVWDFDYDAAADAETLDPAAADESVTSTVTVPGTARLAKVTSINLTSANFAVGDTVQYIIRREGADAGDTLAASAYLLGAYFEYADA